MDNPVFWVGFLTATAIFTAILYAVGRMDSYYVVAKPHRREK